MENIRLDEDIHPLSDFRASVATFVKQVNETRRPLVLTQRGRGVAVLLGIREFEALRERLALLEDIRRAEQQLDTGKGLPHAAARKRVLKGIAE